MEGLTRDSRERLLEVFREDDGFVSKVWDEMHSSNPELCKLIEDEGLRLFPDNTQYRARATRFVIEVYQSINVGALEASVVTQP